MANFLNYRNVDFKLNGQNFYATQVSLSAQASVEPVVLNDGTLLNYAPQGAVVGSLGCEFYLTGSLPSFLNITGTDETAITASFAGVSITGVYPKSISFSVEPFQPIVLSAEFDWYGNVKIEEFKEQSVAARNLKEVPNYIASAFKSYLKTDTIFESFSSGPTGPVDNVGNITSFSYNASSDRPAFYKIDEVVPFRVAKLNKTCEVSLSSNSLGKLISIDGKNANTTIFIKDFYGDSLTSFAISGVLTNQSYEVSKGQYLLASASIQQTVTETKTLV